MPAIVSVAVIAALLVALLVAGFSLTGEILDPATLEEGVDGETLALSATVLALTVGLSVLLFNLMRKGQQFGGRKDPPVAA